ncbi:Uncharacterised protein [Chlamydia trachomatis]|nr:Uncharacterised protein [Chlamydia trachomatis]
MIWEVEEGKVNCGYQMITNRSQSSPSTISVSGIKFKMFVMVTSTFIYLAISLTLIYTLSENALV